MITRRSKVWLGAAVLFSLVNLAGAVMAVAGGELLHASVHVGLMLLGAYYAGRILFPRRATIAFPDASGELTDRLTHLELSVDSAAIAIEQVGEGQRFVTRLLAERDILQASSEGAVEQIDVQPQEVAPLPPQP